MTATSHAAEDALAQAGAQVTSRSEFAGRRSIRGYLRGALRAIVEFDDERIVYAEIVGADERTHVFPFWPADIATPSGYIRERDRVLAALHDLA